MEHNPACNCQFCLNERYSKQAQNTYGFGQGIGGYDSGVHREPVRSLEERKVLALEKIANCLAVLHGKLANHSES